jgi:outer membrane protein assembly factor BamB
VYALDPGTGKPRWTFDRDGDMLPTASSPLLDGGRLFLGEGMHRNFQCRFYCLDPATGRPDWSFETGDHIEGGPVAVGTSVIFSAGNDGLYALDAANGKPRWNFREGLHIDSTPAVVGRRVYVGSGPSRKHQATEVVCVEAATGKAVWRTPVPLPAWAPPVAVGGRVFAGLGNGRLTEAAQPPETPAGKLACLDADTGAVLWTFPCGDAVFGRPVVLGDRVLFGSRDGNLYAVSLDGKELFRVPVGGPVIAAAAAGGGQVFAASVPGRVVCLDPADGREVWRHDLARTGIEPYVYAPIVAAGSRLYVASELRTPGASSGIVRLSCFDLPAEAPEKR